MHILSHDPLVMKYLAYATVAMTLKIYQLASKFVWVNFPTLSAEMYMIAAEM